MAHQLRLNDSGRLQLRRLIGEVVDCPDEKADLDAAYAVAAPLVRKVVEEKYPPRDMRVLKKYEAAFTDDCIKLHLTDGSVDQFHFAEDAGPLVAHKTYSGAMYLADQPTSDAVRSWSKAKSIYDKALKAKHLDYEALVVNARTLEQVAEIWPEAETLRSRLGGQAVAIMSPDVVDRIRADVARRKAA